MSFIKGDYLTVTVRSCSKNTSLRFERWEHTRNDVEHCDS